jgi:DNA-binding GntR family transcriptional regulator
MANELERLKDEIVALVSAAPNQRLRPHEMEKDLAHKLGISIFAVQEAVRALAEEGRLVFTYRDPCSYVEIPAPSESARPAA